MARKGVDVEEVIDELSLKVAINAIGFVALIHIEYLHPA